MIEWTKSMNQTFEYFTVDPYSWTDIKKITTIKSCTITRDSTSNTLGSATIESVDVIGESYVRIYLVAIQNDVTYKIPIGTYLVQTPNSSFDGKTRNTSLDAYTPLLELTEKKPPLGYAILKGENILKNSYNIINQYLRAPVVETVVDKNLEVDFVANTSDNWLIFVKDLIRIANYTINIDELGRIIFEPKLKNEELQPIFTYTDDNSSILLPEINIKHDIYKIPNVVEVIVTIDKEVYVARVENNDNNSITSIKNRGREIIHRENTPKFQGIPTKEMVDEYAKNLLRTMSEVEYEVSYSHGYCPVRVGDCVRLNYKRANLIDITARVVSQTIKCDTGCTVSERAVFTKNLYR